jgi:Spy/CpxP family protein refolding chaperone
MLAAILIFAAGVATGGLTVQLRRLVHPRPASSATAAAPWLLQRPELQVRMLSQRMTRQLDLTADQRERLEIIVRESQGRMRGVAEEVAPRTRAEFQRLRQQIHEILNPDQRAKFDKLYQRREAGHRRGDRSAPPERDPAKP